MTTESTDAKAVKTSPQKFPAAKVTDRSAGLFRASKMWWVTLLCLILAIWLTFNSLPKSGPLITIRFPQGHGLKQGDTVRYRGIEVGQVTDVSLNATLSGIDVRVMLAPGEGLLNREGTRFWIVRPRLSLTQVQGLDTAVGAKYIGVSPGDPAGAQASEFEGLAISPPDELDDGGLQVVLRSDNRHGMSAGSVVGWRGVQVGRVLSVNLSPDARHVHTTIRIDRKYRKLVRQSSKFWVTSGFGVDIGLGGVKLNANSLSSILDGGVSFLTIADDSGNRLVRSGHVFSLSKEPDEEWFEAESSVPLVDFKLPETVLVTGKFTTSTLGLSRTKSFLQHGILVKDNGSTILLTAVLPEANMESQSGQLTVTRPGQTALNVDFTSANPVGDGLISIDVDGPATIDLADSQVFVQPEDCLLFRSAVIDGAATPVMQTIDLEDIVLNGDQWLIQDEDVDFSEWHGAPVMAMSTGRFIGILTTVDGRAQIAVPGPR